MFLRIDLIIRNSNRLHEAMDMKFVFRISIWICK